MFGSRWLRVLLYNFPRANEKTNFFTSWTCWILTKIIRFVINTYSELIRKMWLLRDIPSNQGGWNKQRFHGEQCMFFPALSALPGVRQHRSILRKSLKAGCNGRNRINNLKYTSTAESISEIFSVFITWEAGGSEVDRRPADFNNVLSYEGTRAGQSTTCFECRSWMRQGLHAGLLWSISVNEGCLFLILQYFLLNVLVNWNDWDFC